MNERIPKSRVLFEKLIVQLLQKFPTLSRTRGFITVFTADPPIFLVLSQILPVHVLPSYLIKVHFNIILPSTPRSSK